MDDQLRPNLTLRRLMSEYGFTCEGLAEAVNNETERLSGQPGNCAARLVGYWLSGRTTWPRSRARRSLEAVFGRPADELGFRSPVPGPVGVTVRMPVTATPQEPPVLRRKFVLGLGTLLALPALPESGRLGMNDVARIREAEAYLMQFDRQHGSAQLSAAAGRYVEHVEQAVRHCTCSGRVQTQLHQALGEMCARVGWLAYDCTWHDQARRYWDTALRYALLARDPMLQARIWASLSRQAVDLGHGAEAVTIARAALDVTRGRRDPRLSTLLHTRVALGHAVNGEKGRCGHSLHRAEQSLDGATDDAPPWLMFCGPDEVAAQAALCFYNLGDYPRAAQADQEALALLAPEEFRRNAFATHVSLARNLLAAGEADGALEVGQDALGLVREVRSPRWGEHLARFRDDVLGRAPRGAQEFADHYREATA
ncbi:hypothetical protein [Streptomyces sp. NBC_01538]|uniref:hypothetical protein n=1 Tax=Streptomyces sp. NBC_01538 TaxID=2903897 RepID=UPI00386423AD